MASSARFSCSDGYFRHGTRPCNLRGVADCWFPRVFENSYASSRGATSPWSVRPFASRSGTRRPGSNTWKAECQDFVGCLINSRIETSHPYLKADARSNIGSRTSRRTCDADPLHQRHCADTAPARPAPHARRGGNPLFLPPRQTAPGEGSISTHGWGPRFGRDAKTNVLPPGMDFRTIGLERGPQSKPTGNKRHGGRSRRD
jgi:hypothetical protein